MIFRNDTEKLDTEEIVNSKYINWEAFRNSTILITGATGLIGSQAVKALLLANEKKNTNIKILALVRNLEKAQKIFLNKTNLEFVVQNITEPLNYSGKIDYIIHTANSTSSKSFVETPVETIDTIINGTKSVLEFSKNNGVKSLVYLSSMEVFGQIDFEKSEPLKEEDYGYIDILNVRSSYPEGKKLAETMCVCYASEYNIPVKIARLVQTIGSQIDYNDNRVFAQFAKNIVESKDIVLHTKGESTRNYCYVTDAVTAILTILERGQNGECYNVANQNTACSIKEMAEMLSNKYKTSKVQYDLDENKSSCYLKPTKTVLSSDKLEQLNWQPTTNLPEMYNRLICNLKNNQ